MNQYQTITFNAADAEKAGAASNFIPGNTEQLVVIDRAEFVTSKNTGAQGIEIDVHNRDKQKAYFTIWHLKGDGSANEYSMRLLQSLMGVTGVQTLTPGNAEVPKYDYDRKETVKTNCINARELLGKQFVGLFLETHDTYQGKEKTKIELFAAYNRERQSYREANAGMPAADIEDATAAMLKKSEKSKEAAERAMQNSWQPPAYDNPPTFDDFDNVPF